MIPPPPRFSGIYFRKFSEGEDYVNAKTKLPVTDSYIAGCGSDPYYFYEQTVQNGITYELVFTAGEGDVYHQVSKKTRTNYRKTIVNGHIPNRLKDLS